LPADPGALDGKLTAGRVDVIVGELESLATLPAVAARLSALAAEAGEPGREQPLRGLIGSDPALAAKTLSAANSSASRRLGTVSEAVERIGLPAAISAALSVKIFEPSDCAELAECGLDLSGFWRHCLAVACAAEMLSKLADLSAAPEEAFICGLLHDIGKLAMVQCLPKSYARAVAAAKRHNGNIKDCECAIIGVDHCTFGRRLAERWLLPQAACQVIWLHHQPLEAIPESLPGRRLVAAVGLADAMAREHGLGFSGSYAPPGSVSRAAGRLGFGEAAIAEVLEQMSEGAEHRARLLGLGERAGEQLYRRALADANAELGRLNEQLRRRAERLGGQATAFRHMRDFVAALRPDALVGEVLTGIARVMAEVLDCSPAVGRPLVAYSISQEDKAVLAVRWDGSDSRLWRIFELAEGIDLSCVPEAPAPAEQAVSALLADPNDLGEWLELSACRHRALISAGRWTGGLFYPREDPHDVAGEEGVEIAQAVASAAAVALAIVQGRAKAMLLSEQLAGASQVLADNQEAIAEARTMAALGELAAGAAHELNNPLAVVSGRAQVMGKKAASDEERKVWQLISDQAKRISDVLSELMDFASCRREEPAAIDVSELLREAANEFSSSNHPQAAAAKVDTTTEAYIPPVLAGRRQIRDALVELIKNGAAAGAPHPHIHLAAQYDETSDRVLLTVTDNGAGMDERTAAKAFTPFFSAQRAGRRLGMGLPKARRYVEISGGKIWIRSRVGEGTTVYVRLTPARERAEKSELPDAES
jgi:putative nucleotidyltransferase with HDIG domain